MNDVERDIIKNAYYMISLFENEKNNELSDISKAGNAEEASNKAIISNLKLQKLMYFVEAYYMNKYNDNSLYNSEWSAWNYGPVNMSLYNYYRKYGSVEISLNENERNQINDLPPKNIDCIKKVYDVLGQFSAFDLVTLTHLKGSPWYEIKESNSYDFEKLNGSIIDKARTKEWFMNIFGKSFDLVNDNE